MFNINKNINKAPITDDSSGKENKEKLGELEAVPIFRDNDLYRSIFPEINPAFNKDEKIDTNKLFEIIAKNENKKIILDMTCLEDLNFHKDEFLKNIPENFYEKEEVLGNFGKKDLRVTSRATLLKWKNIELLKNSIDGKIAEVMNTDFLEGKNFKLLFEIAKKKNENISRIIILADHISDHSGGLTNINDLKESVRKEFGLESIVMDNFDNSQKINDSDLIVLDRHNYSLPKGVSSKNTLYLPVESEIQNYESYTGKTLDPNMGLVKMLRKKFEKN